MGQKSSSVQAVGLESMRLGDGPPSKRRRYEHNPVVSLARELRDHIYHYAWEGTHIHYLEKGWGVDARYPDSGGKCTAAPSKLPQWLLVHPTVLAEGLEQFHCQAQFSVGSGEDAIPLSIKHSQSTSLKLTKARYLTLFAVRAFYRYDPATWLNFDDTPRFASAPVGFLLSELHRDLLLRTSDFERQGNLRHLKVVILWDPITYNDAQGLELQSKMRLEILPGMFPAARSIQFFVALNDRWHALPRPCTRAVGMFQVKLGQIMLKGQRQPSKLRSRQGKSIEWPKAEYWDQEYSKVFRDRRCDFTISCLIRSTCQSSGQLRRVTNSRRS